MYQTQEPAHENPEVHGVTTRKNGEKNYGLVGSYNSKRRARVLDEKGVEVTISTGRVGPSETKKPRTLGSSIEYGAAKKGPFELVFGLKKRPAHPTV